MTITETKYQEAASQPGAANEITEMRATPSATVSTALPRLFPDAFAGDLNDPLDKMQYAVGLLDKLIAKANGGIDPDVAKLFPMLKGGVDRMNSLITTVRSRLESQWLAPPACDPVSLGPLMDDVIQSDAALFSAAGIRVDKEIAADLPALSADVRLLRQVFVNLFRNAVAAMPEGGVLSLRAGERKGSVWLECADTGVGIAPDQDPFQPLAASMLGNIGLGLTITRRIVENHGGTITYGSNLGKGTTFSLRFPCSVKTKTRSFRHATASAGDR